MDYEKIKLALKAKKIKQTEIKKRFGLSYCSLNHTLNDITPPTKKVVAALEVVCRENGITL